MDRKLLRGSLGGQVFPIKLTSQDQPADQGGETSQEVEGDQVWGGGFWLNGLSSVLAKLLVGPCRDEQGSPKVQACWEEASGEPD